ncbi:MAG: choice-of-anchor tandem repeat NxxGxxAF-containing protein [Planctomycetota bacterium]
MNRRFSAWLAAAVLPIVHALPAWAATLNGPAATGVTTVVSDTITAAPEGNGVFSNFSFFDLTLNDAGQTAFRADLTGTTGGNSDNSGIYRGDGTAGSLVNIARAGQAAPDGNGSFSGFSFSGLTLNDAGQTAFNADLTGTTGGNSDSSGIYRGDGTASSLVNIAREGQAAPDGNGSFSGLFYSGVTLNDAGQTAFRASLKGTSGGNSDNSGIYRGNGTAGSLVNIARAGQAAPEGNGSFSGFFSSRIALNDAGQAAFRADLTGTSGGSSDNSGVYRGDESAGSLVNIAREGQAVPEGNGSFSSFDTIALNDAGQTAFRAFLTGTSGGGSDSSGLYRGDGMAGSLVTIARAGQGAPDGNGSFSGFLSPVLNDAGQAAFVASLTGTSGGISDNRGIYRGDGAVGSLVSIAREGQAAPTSDGMFRGVLVDLFEPASNNLGQLVFLADIDLQDGGIPFDERGLFFYDDALGLTSIARKGDAFDGSTITDFGIFEGGARANAGSDVNDFGQVAYSYSLADGRQGVAITTLDSAIAGDANFDGTVDLADFGLLRAGFGSSGNVTRLDGDFNKDGVVDLADFGILRSNFGSSAPAADLAMMDAWAATVPEPGLAGASLCALGLLWRRRTT